MPDSRSSVGLTSPPGLQERRSHNIASGRVPNAYSDIDGIDPQRSGVKVSPIVSPPFTSKHLCQVSFTHFAHITTRVLADGLETWLCKLRGAENAVECTSYRHNGKRPDDGKQHNNERMDIRHVVLGGLKRHEIRQKTFGN